MRIFSFTDRGKVRPSNEDALWMNGELGLFLVSDGIGSTGKGAEASQAVVRACRDALKGSPRPDELLPTLIRKANNSLYEMASERHGTLGATVALLWLRGREARVAWAGDSRVYRLRQGALERLTTDHTRAGELAGKGVAPPSAADKKSALTKSLGQGPTADYAQGGPLEIQTGDLYMVCSDGVSDMLDDEQLRGFLACGPIKGSAAIRQAALEMGGDDNLTAILVEVEETDLDRALDATAIASILKEAAARDVAKSSRQAVVPPPQQKPRGLVAFYSGLSAGGVGKLLPEALLAALILGLAFLTPELLKMAGQRLESISPLYFLGGGAVLYLLLAKLRAG